MTRAADRRKRLIVAAQSAALAGFVGVKPATMREILSTEAKKPLRGGARDLQHEGLFGDGHLQKELF